jgi:hypothetical protein
MTFPGYTCTRGLQITPRNASPSGGSMAGRRRVAATCAARAGVIGVGPTAEIPWTAADDSACDTQSHALCSPTHCANGGICRKRGIDDAAFCDVGPSQSGRIPAVMGCTDHNRRRYAKVRRRIGGGRVLPRPTDERRCTLAGQRSPASLDRDQATRPGMHC